MFVCACPHHTLVPDEGQTLFGAVGPLGDQGEVVLAHCALGGVEGAVRTASDLEIPAVERGWSQHKVTVSLTGGGVSGGK